MNYWFLKDYLKNQRKKGYWETYPPYNIKIRLRQVL